jgi:hypothetical protein
MQSHLVPFGAGPILADVGVFAPEAAGQLCFLPDGPADGAHLQQVSNDVPGVTSPGFKGFSFFPNVFEFVVAEHNLSPASPCPDVQPS